MYEFFNIVEHVIKLIPKNVQDISIKVLQKNAYFAHHENMLLEMMGDNDERIPCLAV